MNSIFLFINFCLFFWIVLLETLDLVRVSQMREYRFDRFRAYLDTKEGRDWFYDKWRIFIFILTFGWLYIRHLPINLELSLYSLTFIAGLGYFISSIRRYKKGKFYRPVPTKRAIFVYSINVLPIIAVMILGLIYNLRFEFSVYILLISVIFLHGWFYINWFLFESFKKLYLYSLQYKVFRKTGKYPDLRFITITGAIGKSSTKSFLNTIFEESKIKVLTTPGNINSEIGIFKFLLKSDLSKYDYCILEVGAYKKKEVEFIAYAIRPFACIYTGYSPQHLALYGTKSNIFWGDLEVLKYMKNDGNFYANIDHEYGDHLVDLQKKASKSKYKLITYSKTKHTDIVIEKSDQNKDGFSISLKYKKHKISSLQTKIIHEAHLGNLSLAIACCLDLGITSTQIKDASKNFKAPKSAIVIEKIGQATIIWDEYNSTYEGTITALDSLGKLLETKKYCVFSGIYELGSEKRKVYSHVSEKMFDVCTKIFCTTEEALHCLLKYSNKSISHKLFLDPYGDILSKYAHSRSDFLIEGKVMSKWKNPWKKTI